jgi:hypothetical protein
MFASRPVCFASDAMTVSDEYRAKAAEFRAKANSQRDPLFCSMFETLSMTYFARHHERDYRPKLAFRPSPPIAVINPPKQKGDELKNLESKRGRKEYKLECGGLKASAYVTTLPKFIGLWGGVSSS